MFWLTTSKDFLKPYSTSITKPKKYLWHELHAMQICGSRRSWRSCEKAESSLKRIQFLTAERKKIGVDGVGEGRRKIICVQHETGPCMKARLKIFCLHTYTRTGSREDHKETIWNKSLIASLAANSFHAVLHV